MKIITAAMAALILCGCAPKPQYTFTVDAAKPKAPAAIKERCSIIDKKLVKRAGVKDSVPMGDLTATTDYLVGLYGECAERDAAKARWIESQGF